MKVLSADVGGTNTRFGVFEVQGGRHETIAEAAYPSRGWPTLESALREFLAVYEPSYERACLGVAGAVREGRVRTTNLPWLIESGRLARVLGLERVLLINDLEAHAHSLAGLRSEDFAVLHHGREQPGNKALIAAGTGLGEAGLIWDGRRHRVVASEGGHADFAPRDPLEMALQRYLSERHEHVSWEHVLSGPGLFNIYQFLLARGGVEPPGFSEELKYADPAAVISRWALEKRCPACAAAVELFVSLYGSEAGNLALRWLSLGGVYLGGGMAPRLLSLLARGNFVHSFAAKGRMRELLNDIPVRVILNDRAALIGAALYGAAVGD